MRIPRIHTDQPLHSGASVRLPDPQAHYIINVLRLKVDSPLILFNGDGRDYSGRISALGKRQAEVEITGDASPATESGLRVVLGLGLSKGDRMDFAIQKSTELGVSEIVPLFTEHGEVRLKGERLDKKRQHWRQVAISACEQSGRSIVPLIAQPLTLSDWLTQVRCPRKYILDPRLQGGLNYECAAVVETALLIGPEGGFSEREVAMAEQAGFNGIQLGPRILRTETAPVAALAVLQFLWGDFRV